MPKASRTFARLAATLVGATAIIAMTPAAAAEFSAGGYSFSDELGGFRLIAATGNGRPSDPIVLVAEFDEVTPVTLVIRNRALSRRLQSGHTEFSLVTRIVNRSERVWAAFEFELQEQLRQPSVYSDGLSFKQFGALSGDVRSDSFFDNERLFEPYDRIEFRNGHVDPESTVSFMVTITDPTPVAEFYLVLDPKLLSASLPLAGQSVAAR